MRVEPPNRRQAALLAVCAVATLQVVWSYMRQVQPYMDTAKYELGTDRMPFQGRVMMMLPLRFAGHSRLLNWLIAHSWRSVYWFPVKMKPETVMEAILYVACVALTGCITVALYRRSSRRRWLTPAIYPLFLVVWAATYMLHTVQNFRFFYDPPSLAFFAVALYLIYTRRHWGWFVALFPVATVNRETTLLLLPLYAIDHALGADGRIVWRRLFAPRTLAVVVPLGLFWCAWTAGVHHYFAHNRSEFYARFDWNFKSLAYPPAWPQLLSAGGYLLIFVVALRRRITDPRLRAWMWLLPVWLAFMFTYGILIEVRIWGELIPWIVCSSALIAEELLAVRVGVAPRRAVLALTETVIVKVAEPDPEEIQAA